MRMGLTPPWLLALLGLTLLRLAAAAVLPPAPDEAYYWVWGRALALSYYDHPPMVALWTALGSALAGDTALGLRLLGPIGVGLASLLLADAAERLFPGRRAGLWSAALLNATLLFGAGAVLMTPDTPLLVFWSAALWALARLQASQDGRWWLAFGVLAGLSLLSKYTAALLGLGVLLWLLAEPAARRWFLDWRLWAGGALAVLVFSPVILWNALHGWASFAKQGGRAGSQGSGTALRYLGELVGGQAGLATPIIFVLCVAGTVAACRSWWRGRDAGAGLLVVMTLPAALLFLWQATGSRVQGNWPAILYPSACIAAAACLGPRWQRWYRPGAALGLALTLLVLVQAAFAPLPLARRHDPTLARLGGWPAFATALEAERQARGAGFIAAEEYGLASILALHLPPGTKVVALGDRWDLFALSRPADGARGLLVRSERRDGAPLWPGAAEIGVVARARHGIEAERYRLHDVTVAAGDPPLVLLPARR
ncbi:UDP-phosphomannose--protein mannosyltransferase [Pseudoroseomonas deserti]|uniref:UDP-phosphomannose--protein mannosyltransferase n=1 Tax=Teichococcus deserti TaxID=1817963 RepID=A0A1V2H4E2_9PROT|nr:glycosyltransferase family 39 protein [Pseudoroseomonas deserti]ONG55889.1 UDP-phosphomannose--protein mannosyltransferase [Pseudoroseomonas deserti]